MVLFTGLIWWVANQSVSGARQFTVRLRAAKATGLSVRITSGEEYKVSVYGPRRMLDGLEARLRAAGDVLDYRLPEDESRAAELVERSARDVMAETSLMKESGLTVTDVDPPQIMLSVDKLVTLTMEVEPTFGAMHVESVASAPASVRVTLPSREAAQHSRKLSPNLEAALRDWRAEHPEDMSFSLNVALPVARGVESVEPPNVTVSGRLIQLLDTAQKGPVQILPAIPVSLQKQYVVEPTTEGGFRTDLTVRGPKSELAALNPEQIRAYFDVLTADEGLVGQNITRRVVVVLPKGIELVGDPPDVTFRLVRNAPTGEPTP